MSNKVQEAFWHGRLRRWFAVWQSWQEVRSGVGVASARCTLASQIYSMRIPWFFLLPLARYHARRAWRDRGAVEFSAAQCDVVSTVLLGGRSRDRRISLEVARAGIEIARARPDTAVHTIALLESTIGLHAVRDRKPTYLLMVHAHKVASQIPNIVDTTAAAGERVHQMRQKIRVQARLATIYASYGYYMQAHRVLHDAERAAGHLSRDQLLKVRLTRFRIRWRQRFRR